MPPDKPSFVNVDELMRPIGLHQVAHFYGASLPELHRAGAETRTRCFLNCGRTKETGNRVLAIQEDDPATKWRCHEYGCGKGGNLISICDLLKPGESGGGRPRGERFKAIAGDLQAMAGGTARSESPIATAAPAKPAPAEVPKVNLPLAESENERARSLVALDAKFVRAVAGMPPSASAYFRRRPFLSPEVCTSWRVGYLPRNAGGDQSGGTMRGAVIYAYHSAEGKLLTWFGRDPDFEEKHRLWRASDQSGREPEKFHFVKGFHRGIELFGQERLHKPASDETAIEHGPCIVKAAIATISDATRREMLRALGLIVVEGPNDVIRLSTLGVPAVGLCSNTITREQAAKAAELANAVAGGIVTVFLDCDGEGEKGMKQALGYLAQLAPVRLAWTSQMHGGQFKGRQPESLSESEWAEIAAFLQRKPNHSAAEILEENLKDSCQIDEIALPSEVDEWTFI